MREDMKRKLDESVPEDVTLSDAKKRQILMAAQSQGENRMSSRVPKLVPAFVGVAVIGLSGILGYPYVSDWQEEQGAFEEKDLEESLQKVVLPKHEYSELVNAVFHTGNGVLVYQEDLKIYSYNIETNEEDVLAEVPEGMLIQDVAVEGDWLVWTERMAEEAENSSVLNIRNLSAGTTETLFDLYATSLVIDGDQLSYLTFGESTAIPSYQLLDLKTLKQMEVVNAGEGADSIQAFNDGIIVIPDRREEQNITILTVFDANEKEIIGEFEVPSKTAMNIHFDGNKIYAHLADENFVSTLVSIELETGEMTEFDSPEFNAFSVYGNYVALSVPEAGADTVKLFEIDDSALIPLPTLNKINERLVKPRFTDEGTLVVNGEGTDLAMYLLDVAK